MHGSCGSCRSSPDHAPLANARGVVWGRDYAGACRLGVIANQLRPSACVSKIEITIMAANKKERFVGGFTVTYLPLAVDPAAPRRDFSDHVMPICRPDWSSSKLSQLNFKEGVTNKLLGFYQDGEEKEEDIVLLRLNGKNTEVFINRERELMIVLWLHTKGLNPPVYCQLENGLCYGFAPGRMVKLSELHDPAMGKRVAVALAQLHTLEVPPSLQGCMLDVFFDGYLSKVPTKFSKSKNNDRCMHTHTHTHTHTLASSFSVQFPANIWFTRDTKERN